MPVDLPPNPPAPDKRVNWELAKSCLAELGHVAPSILSQGVIIGGIACWFYRHLLTAAHDADFRVPELSVSEEQAWLSKDIDFTNFFAQDARELLKDYIAMDSSGRPHLKLAGIPIGFAQVGVTFDPESAWAKSWIGAFTWNGTVVECRVLDPISLYREKTALAERRSLASDHLHRALLAEYVRYETCRQSQALVSAQSLEERTAPLNFLLDVRDRASEVNNDHRVHRRIQETVSRGPGLTPSEKNLLADLGGPGGA